MQRENLCLYVQNIEQSVKSAEANMTKAMQKHSDNFLEITQQVQSLHKIQASWESSTAFMLDFPEWRNFLNDKIKLDKIEWYSVGYVLNNYNKII